MKFDDESFALFLDLDDVTPEIVESKEAQEVRSRIESRKAEEELDLSEFDDNDDDDFEFDAEKSFEEGFDDEEDEDEDNTQSNEEDGDESSEDTEDDGETNEESVDVDLDTVITLPNGTSLTIEELQNGYAEHVAIQEQRTQVMDLISSFEEAKSRSEEMFKLSVLECDKALKEYEGVDLKALRRQDPAAYGQHRDFIDATLEKRKALINELRVQEERTKQEEYEDYVRKCTACREVLEHDIPGWSNELYQELMQFAVDSGVSEEDIIKENRPTFFKMAYKAMKYDRGESMAKKAKVKRVGAPSKVVSSAGVTKDSSKKEKAIAAYKQGKLSNEEAFSLLDD